MIRLQRAQRQVISVSSVFTHRKTQILSLSPTISVIKIIIFQESRSVFDLVLTFTTMSLIQQSKRDPNVGRFGQEAAYKL